ncbi:MAG TPA: DUF72 domain-containing protein, partial [Kofleriaceae bacterium]
RIGCVDVPARVDRERYFKELTYCELSALFTGPQKPSTFSKWAELAPVGALGLVAPFPITHRKPPASSKLWPTDAATGEFRDSPLAREAIAELDKAADQVNAGFVVYRSPDNFSASAANRDQLKKFFAELAPDRGHERVWIPGGLWDVRTAVKFAGELGVTCAFDPLVRDPNEPAEIFYNLEATSLYLRIESARAGLIRNEKLEDLVALIEHYENLPVTVVFASPERWQDARNFKKLLVE